MISPQDRLPQHVLGCVEYVGVVSQQPIKCVIVELDWIVVDKTVKSSMFLMSLRDAAWSSH